jgi:triacylglycerol esterase/lipase EstA (alpha/beta hydrolase family)
VAIARLLRFVFAVEVLSAAGIAVWLGAGEGWGWASALATGVAAPVLVHAGIVGIEFGIAGLARSPTPPPCRLGAAGAVGTFAREFAASLRTFQVAIPFQTGQPLAGGSPGSAEVPVLLVHGYFCNRQVWRPFAAWLAERGHAVEAVDLEPTFGSIDDYVVLVSEGVRRLRERTGAPRVALVCHSMGGLAARAWLRATGGDAAAAVVTLGTPHRGTFHARFGVGRNTRQMRIDGEWLRALQASETPATGERFTVILSHHDNIVAPQAIQTIPGARTVEFGGIGHLSLVYDRRVWAAVEEALAWAD